MKFSDPRKSTACTDVEKVQILFPEQALAKGRTGESTVGELVAEEISQRGMNQRLHPRTAEAEKWTLGNRQAFSILDAPKGRSIPLGSVKN